MVQKDPILHFNQSGVVTYTEDPNNKLTPNRPNNTATEMITDDTQQPNTVATPTSTPT